MSASPLKNCYLKISDARNAPDIERANSVLDTIFSSIYIVIVLIFVSYYTKKTVKTLENEVNYWIIGNLLCEPGPTYITISNEDKMQIMREALIELKETNPEILHQEKTYLKSEHSKGIFLKNERKKAGLKAINTYLLKHPYADGNRYKSKQSAWFH